MISNGYEYSLGGFDLEFGRLIPGVSGLTTYAGMFYFNHNDIDEALVGPRLRAEYDLAKVMDVPLTWAHSWVKNLQIEGAWQYDDVRGNLWSIGLQLSIPFSNKPSSVSSNDLTSRMTEYVRRDINVVSIAKSGLTDYKPYTKDGTVWEFAQVNTSAEFADLIAKPAVNQPDAYVINNDITTSTPNLQLPDNLLLTGWKFQYETGHFFTLTSSLKSITAPADNDLFFLGKNNTLRDLNLKVTQTAEQDANFVLKNKGSDPLATDPSGASVGNLIIDNITANGQLFVAVGDVSQDSKISIANSTFNMGSTSGVLTANAAIDLEAWNGSSMTVNNVDNNTINFGDNVDNAMGMYFYIDGNTSSSQTIGSIDNNTINFGDNVTGAFGILLNIPNASSQIVTSITGNKINVGDYTGDFSAIALYNYYTTDAGTQTIGSINKNQITFGKYAGTLNGKAYAFYIGNSANQTIGSISHNTITFGDYAGAGIDTAYGNAFGINFSSNSGIQNITGSLSDNMIIFGDYAATKTGTGAGLASGITSSNNTGTQTIANLSNNTFGFGANSTADNISAISLVNTTGSTTPNTITVNGMSGNKLNSSNTMTPTTSITLTNESEITGSIITINVNPISPNVSTVAALESANSNLLVITNEDPGTIIIND